VGIGPGDDVIVPAFTFVATANAAEYVRARPVFVDIDLRTFNIDPDQIEQAITPQTKAILPVHLFGLCADMQAVNRIARQRRLKVIEDAACALGSRCCGAHAGTMGDSGAFSFHPRKPITTGEGGMLTTNDATIASLAEMLRSHGASMSDLERHRKGGFAMPEHNVLGFNYRMTDIQAAVGIVQMQRADWIIEQRRSRAARYDQTLETTPDLQTPFVPEGFVHSYQSYVTLIPEGSPVSRDELALELQNNGIAVRVGTHAVPMLGYYRDKYGYRPEDFPQAHLADRCSLALPLFPQMRDEDQDRVVNEIRRITRACRVGN
jgi:dTDP-4-amino-4,6-dideoxygalactose transaminase